MLFYQSLSTFFTFTTDAHKKNAMLCTSLAISEINLVLLNPILWLTARTTFGSLTTHHLDIAKIKFQTVSFAEVITWLSLLCGDNYRLWFKKLASGWTKQKDGPLSGKFSEKDVPNLMIKIRGRFTPFGILFLSR